MSFSGPYFQIFILPIETSESNYPTHFAQKKSRLESAVHVRVWPSHQDHMNDTWLITENTEKWFALLNWDMSRLWCGTGTGAVCETGLEWEWFAVGDTKLECEMSFYIILCTLYQARNWAPQLRCNFGRCNVRMHTNVERSSLEGGSIHLSMYIKVK